MIVAVRLWILFSALLVGAGWILSALHVLNPAGYGMVFLVAMGAAFVWWRKTEWRPRQSPAQVWHKLKRRCKRPAPVLFLAILGVAFLGGILYTPMPTDASSYRTPRVLHWLAAEHWHWIHTFDIRMNIANCGMEWLTAPLILLTRTDRFIFIINWISFLLLPGLVYSLFRQLRVSGRVAWWWMWVLPAGFCYALQAGTLGNDSMAAIYALAAVSFALRAVSSGQVSDVWLSMLAIALTTGVKETNLPLVLLWAVAVLPAFRLFSKHALGTALTTFLSVLISAAPTMYLNLLHDCNWAGKPNHPGQDWIPWQHIQAVSPIWSLAGNAISLPVQTFAPPFFPIYQTWTSWMHHFVQTRYGVHFSSFEDFCKLPSFMTEQSASLGFMVGLLLPLSLTWVWSWQRRQKKGMEITEGRPWHIHCLRWLPWGLLILFMVKITSFESGRMLAPYYPFLLAGLLAPAGMLMLVRRIWWQRFALLAMATTVSLLVVSPIRPLVPAATVLAKLAQQHPNSNAIERVQSFYSAAEINLRYRHAFQEDLPQGEVEIGYATDSKGLEPALWRPFTRCVERVLPDDTRQRLDALGIHFIVVDTFFLKLTNSTLEQLLQGYNAQLVKTLELPQGWKRPPGYLFLVRLN